MNKSATRTVESLANTLNDVDYETTILIEEMSELAQVVCKLKRKMRFPDYNKYDKKKLYEELAHVEISLAICKTMLDIDDGVLDKAIDDRISVMINYRSQIAPDNHDGGNS